MAWVGRDLKDHPVPTPCCGQGCQSPDQAAQGPIQPGPECLQGWGIHSLLGQPVQCVTTLWVKSFPLLNPKNKIFRRVLKINLIKSERIRTYANNFYLTRTK